MTHAITNIKSGRCPQRRGGWNLIELLVVISIISILLAILINAASEGKGPIENTKVILRGAIAAATEYEVATSQKVSHTAGTGTGTIGKFCFQLWKLEKTKNALLSLGKDAVTGAVGNTPPTAIMDGWGRPLQYFSGEGTTTEAGMVKWKYPYLASAGPDGIWGTINATTNVRNTDGAADNIYSFELE
jgi:prepilin-type N-terminal cleavage/methylation domain-containing protein